MNWTNHITLYDACAARKNLLRTKICRSNCIIKTEIIFWNNKNKNKKVKVEEAEQHLRKVFAVGAIIWKPKKFNTWVSIFNTCARLRSGPKPKYSNREANKMKMTARIINRFCITVFHFRNQSQISHMWSHFSSRPPD